MGAAPFPSFERADCVHREAGDGGQFLLGKPCGLTQRLEVRAKRPRGRKWHQPHILLPGVRASYVPCTGVVRALSMVWGQLALQTGHMNIETRSKQWRPYAAGDRFDDVVLPHLPAGRRLARWLVRNEADADDVMQEASLRAFRYFSTFNGGDGRAWFLRIVRNTCNSWQTHRGHAPIDAFDEEHHSHLGSAANPETLLLQTDDVTLIERALSRLTVRARELLRLRELEGLSYRELAETMGIPAGTVMSGLARARDAFRDALVSEQRRERHRSPLLGRDRSNGSGEGRVRGRIDRPVPDLPAGRIRPEAVVPPPVARRPDRPRRESAAAVRAHVVEDPVDAGCAERALIAADARVERVRRQRCVAVLAGRTKFQHGLPPCR
jgi:RNA polymerase sigma-70 factor, ECF subfamily